MGRKLGREVNMTSRPILMCTIAAPSTLFFIGLAANSNAELSSSHESVICHFLIDIEPFVYDDRSV